MTADRSRRLVAAAAALAVATGLAACGTRPPAAPEATRTGAPEPSPVSAPAVSSRPGAGVATGSVMTAVPPTTPAFVWRVAPVTAADLPSSWREGCPVAPDDLRAVTVSHHTFDGRVATGVLVLHADIVDRARHAFAALFAQGFPIRSIRPVDEFGGSDDASMAADNTSAFNCRSAVNDSATTSWSKHAYGRAIDVNPVENPYVLNGQALPPNGAQYADRGRDAPGMLRPGGPALQAFRDAGFTWGGVWSDPDYQHLER